MSLKTIKNKIKATIRTSKVTKAMEAVSAVKMRKSQERALLGRPYAEASVRILERLSHAHDVREHVLFKRNNSERQCLIVITSDKGLAGSLNASVLKAASIGIEPKATDTICFGRKATDFFTRRGYTVLLSYQNVSDDVTLTDMEKTVHQVIQAYENGTYGSISIVYQSFVSTFEQLATKHEILPFRTEVLQEMVKGIVPKKGRYSDIHLEEKVASYTIEQDEEVLARTLFPMLIRIMLYHALLESKASEHSARMVAMKNATDKAEEVSHDLTLQFNKARQAVITREVSEITGGIEAMKTK